MKVKYNFVFLFIYKSKKHNTILGKLSYNVISLEQKVHNSIKTLCTQLLEIVGRWCVHNENDCCKALRWSTHICQRWILYCGSALSNAVSCSHIAHSLEQHYVIKCCNHPDKKTPEIFVLIRELTQIILLSRAQVLW